jgi:molybdate transport system substrate-binding protein
MPTKLSSICLMLLLVLLVGCGGSAPPAPAVTATQDPVLAVASTEPTATEVEATPTRAGRATRTPRPTATPRPPTATPTATATPFTGELVIFADSSLAGAFKEIGEVFNKDYPAVKLNFELAGSQQLAKQLAEGEPADIFSSAHKNPMTVVLDAGQIVTSTYKSFARNRLVVIYPKENPAQVSELAHLTVPGLRVVMGAPESSLGQYTLGFLTKANKNPKYPEAFKQDVLDNVLSYEEDTQAVVAKVLSGEAEVGIVYASDVTEENKDKLGVIEIPEEVNSIASYPIAVIKGSENEPAAKAFVDRVMAATGQEILAKHGFVPMSNKSAGGGNTALPQLPLKITGMVSNSLTITVEELAKLPTIEVQAVDQDGNQQKYKGVLLADLLAQAGLQRGAKEVILSNNNSKPYTQTFRLRELTDCKDCIVAFLSDGTLRNIIPAKKPRFWVPRLMSIEVK